MSKKTWGNGRWHKIGELGSGGQSDVYKVDDANAEGYHYHALKESNRDDDGVIKRLRDEIDVLEELEHSNLEEIVAYNLDADPPYTVTPFHKNGSIEGNSSFVEGLTVCGKLEFCAQICDGVQVMHDKGVVHRDLKPANILLSDAQTPIVADLGICYIQDKETRITGTRESAGTRDYMPPESVRRRMETVPKNFDVYSIGKILYWLLINGRRTLPDVRGPKDAAFDLGGNHLSQNAYDIICASIFSFSITEDPDKRAPSADILGDRIRETKDRLEADGKYIDISSPGTCRYCGQGEYQRVVDGISSLEPPLQGRHDDPKIQMTNYLGIDLGKGPGMLVLACDYCGHLEWFKTSFTKSEKGAGRWNKGEYEFNK